MTIRHHLSDPLLMSYAAGHLPEGFSLVVAAHVSLCDDCRARLEAFECVGGVVLEDCTAVPMIYGGAEAALARAMGDPAPAIPTRRSGPFPAPLHDYIGGDLASVKWRSLGMGARQAILPTGPRSSARLLAIPAGQMMPEHSHRGMELTLVLQGAFMDDGDRFGPGDVEIADQTTRHRPVAEAGAECICLSATDAPLLFHSLLPRIAQRFLRI